MEMKAYILVVAILSTLSSTAWGKQEKTEQWDYMVLAQQWPQSICQDAQYTHQHQCSSIPNNVTTWTVHGLWPNKKGEEGPNFCNSSAKFDPNELKPILPKLLMYWPNLFKDTPEFDFWSHEWKKHGTCAMSLSELSTELKYFSKGIDLNRQHDLLKTLEQLNIKPSDTDLYEYTDFLENVNKGVGAKTKLQCTYNKSTKTQYIAQIEVCINKSFQVIDCEFHSQTSFVASKDLEINNHLSAVYMEQDQRFMRKAPVFQSKLNMRLNVVESLGEVEDCYDTEQIAYPTIQHTPTNET